MHSLRPLQKLAAWILLCVMTAAVAPREVWHACEHTVLAHPGDQQGTSISAACAMCDVGVPVGMGDNKIVLPVIASILFEVSSPEASGVSLGFTPLAADRGPPSIC